MYYFVDLLKWVVFSPLAIIGFIGHSLGCFRVARWAYQRACDGHYGLAHAEMAMLLIDLEANFGEVALAKWHMETAIQLGYQPDEAEYLGVVQMTDEDYKALRDIWQKLGL